ncbi:uncharacterized protein [Euphorbia lathyris]
MSTNISFIIHWGGEIKHGAAGFEYNFSKASARTRRIKFMRRPTYIELIGRMSSAIGLSRNEKVTRIIYKNLIVGQGSMHWSYLMIVDDDDMDVIFENLSSNKGYMHVELFVEYESAATEHPAEFHNNNSQICNNVNQPFHDGSMCVGDSQCRKCVDYGGFSQLQCPIPITTETSQNHINSHELGNQLSYDVGPPQLDDDDDDIILDDTRVDDDCYNYDAFDHEEFEDEVRDDDGGNGARAQCSTIGDNANVVNPSVIDLNVPVDCDMFAAEETEDETTLRNNVVRTWDGSSELSKGLIFSSKDDVQHAVKKYSINNNVSYCVVESKPSLWVIRCIQMDDGCSWRLRAMKKRSIGYWMISRYVGPHTCASVLSRDNKHLDSNMIFGYILEMVGKDPKLKIDVIIQKIKERFEFEISYKKAWIAKEKAMEKVFGNWEESYRKLPAYLDRMEVCNPGTVTILVLDDLSNPNHKMFKRVFWSFKPCIDGFNHCKPILLIDATFLYGKFSHTLLIASTIDGNNRIYPVAFAIVESENQSSWTWFMHCIRQFVTQREGICVISNLHVGVTYAMNHDTLGWKEPLAYHRFCLRHFMSSYNGVMHNNTIKDLLYQAGNEYQTQKFVKQIKGIRDLDEQSFNWTTQYLPERWALSKDGGRRFGHTNTCLAECVNKMLNGVRHMPITSIVEHTFAQMVFYSDRRRGFYRHLLESGEKFTPYCVKNMRDNAQKANGQSVAKYDRRTGLFEVLTAYDPIKGKGGNTRIVNLQKKECDCGKFQGKKMPCSHAIAACKHIQMDFWLLVDKSFTLEESLNCYKTVFQPLTNQELPDLSGPTVIVNSETKRKKGRPKSTRVRNEMDPSEPINKIICKICKESGHNRLTCKNRAESSKRKRAF